ncbi:hypothetical protein [Brevundimonas aurifodinae]|uniref:hypothetical protein n=1 Tax=Brevundimonas aurifodinae TaxID=1508312 RepID=UPI0032E3D2D0
MAGVPPQWIILTPSADDEAWREAIASAVSEAELTFVDADRLSDAGREPAYNEVWLTEDALLPRQFGQKPIVVFMPRPDTAPEAVADARGTYAPHSVWQASLLLARAVDQGAEGALVVSGNQLNHIRERRFSLTDWLSIQPPRAGDVVPVRPAVRTALSLFADGAPQPGLEAVWSERIFQYDERAARDWDAAGQLDVTGRPRILVYGPYLALPAGVWRAKVRFAVDEQACKREFRIDWGTPADFQSTSVSPNAPGVYEIELEHVWPDSAMAEIRLWIMEGAFDGRLDFLGATVAYVSEPQFTLA